MGSDLFWNGKQDNPSLREAMTRELACLCEDLKLEYEIASAAVTFKAKVPFFHKEERLNEKFSKSECLRLTDKDYTVWREGVIIFPYGKDCSFIRELSLAFTNGDELPWEYSNSIASLPDVDRDCTDKNEVPILSIGGYWRDSSSTSYALSTLLALIKRLWVPALWFGSDYNEHEDAQMWMEDSFFMLKSDYEVLDFLRGSFFRKQFQEFCGFGTSKITMNSYPAFWERYKLFADRRKGVKCPDLAALCRMMDIKFSLDWKAAGVSSLLFKPISTGDFLKFYNIKHLGDLCKKADELLLLDKKSKKEPQAYGLTPHNEIENIINSFWFIADDESGFNEKDLLDFIDQNYIQQADIETERTKEQNSGIITSDSTNQLFNSHLIYHSLLADICNLLNQARPDNLVAFYEQLWKLPLFSEVIKYSVWPDGLAVMTAQQGICFFPIWELCCCLPAFQACFDEKPTAVSKIFADMLDSSEDELKLFAEIYRTEDSVSPVPDFSRASVLKEFFLYRYPTNSPVLTINDAKYWMHRLQIGKSGSQWHYGEGFFVKKSTAANGTLLEAFSWKLVSVFVNFMSGEKLNIQGITGSYLSNRIEDDPVLNKFRINYIGELFQYSGKQIQDMIYSSGVQNNILKYTITNVSKYLNINSEDLCSFSACNIKDMFFISDERISIWPLINRKASRCAICFHCDYNKLDLENENNVRFCSARKIIIENELEEFCYNYWSGHKDELFKLHVLGPVFRLTPRGMYGFMEKSAMSIEA